MDRCMDWNFTAVSIVFQSYLANGRVIMKSFFKDKYFLLHRIHPQSLLVL